jgi:pimeloyl-ACP methyl ester carboxylesterase
MSKHAGGRRWARRALIAGGAAAAASLAYSRWERSRAGEPWDPEAPGYPDGEQRTVTTPDGARLAVTIAGPAEGPMVVLSHCWTGSRAVWGPVAERLVERGHRVVLYDQRWHGASTDGDEPHSIPMLGDDLRAVLAEVDAHDAVLVGHSMGGMSVQSYLTEHPVDFKERVRGIVLVATAAKVLGRALPVALATRLMGDGALEWSRRGTVGYAMARRSLGRGARRADVELTLDGLARTTGLARAGFLAAMSGMDLHEGLRAVDVPATVLVGTQDRLTPPRLARELTSSIPGARLVVLPGAGHMLPLEAPDEIVDAIGAVAGG